MSPIELSWTAENVYIKGGIIYGFIFVSQKVANKQPPKSQLSITFICSVSADLFLTKNSLPQTQTFPQLDELMLPLLP